MKFFNSKYKKNPKEKNEIEKSKQIIKKEKEKIKNLKYKIISNSKIFKIAFNIKDDDKKTNIKHQIITMIYYEALGAILCLLILFLLSGGKNYFKLYHELNKLIDTYDTLTSNYYGKIDKKKLIDTATSSMISSIDDSFTNYSNKKITESFEETVTGTYEGIGATVATNKDGNIEVVQVFEDSPAKKAGLQPKDIIKKIDNKDFSKKTSDNMANYVKASKKSKIKFTIMRGDESKELTIKREKINVPTVAGKIVEKDKKKIGYINIAIFSSVTTNQFSKELKKLEKNKIDALIIDVRNNNGGYLKTATEISSLFLKKGQVIYQLADKKRTIKEKDLTKEHRNYPIAILVNKYSASASEILAASIKESYNGHVVGTKTFGKGTVQKVKNLKDGTMIKYTVQKWLTPKGEWIHKKGLAPTDKVEITSKNKDDQLDHAIEILIRDLNK